MDISQEAREQGEVTEGTAHQGDKGRRRSDTSPGTEEGEKRGTRRNPKEEKPQKKGKVRRPSRRGGKKTQRQISQSSQRPSLKGDKTNMATELGSGCFGLVVNEWKSQEGASGKMFRVLPIHSLLETPRSSTLITSNYLYVTF